MVGIVNVIVIFVIILNKIDIVCIGNLFIKVVFLLNVNIYIGLINRMVKIKVINVIINKVIICFFLIVIIELNKYCLRLILLILWVLFIMIKDIVNFIDIRIVVDIFI